MKAKSKKSVSDAEKERRRALYLSLLADPNYENILFNAETGGLIATHKEHNFNVQNGQYEKDVQRIGYNDGHCVILTSEKGKPDDEKYYDGLWDNSTFEIGSSLGIGKNNIKGILQHCQKKKAEIAIIYFPNSKLFSLERLLTGIAKYNGQTNYRFKHIIYVVNDTVYYYI